MGKKILGRPTDPYPIPGRTIYVAKFSGDFPDLMSAIELASDMEPTEEEPVVIVMFPGTYIEVSDDPIQAPDYVNIKAVGCVTVSRTGSGVVFADDLCTVGINISDPNYLHENIYCNEYSKLTYNHTLGRQEKWVRTAEGGEFLLFDAVPGINLQDNFISANIIAPALLGLNSSLSWAVNGVSAGVGVDENNFVAHNVIGGGLKIIVESGGNDNDYSAMHFGSNYPISMSRYPSVTTMIDFSDDEDVAYIAGLVDDSRSDGTAAFALPDNGVFFYLDTDTGDSNVKCVVRIGGVTVDEQSLGPAPPGVSCGNIRRNLITGYIEFILLGNVVHTYTGVLPTDQLQPYVAVVGRAAALVADKTLVIMRMSAVETLIC